MECEVTREREQRSAKWQDRSHWLQCSMMWCWTSGGKKRAVEGGQQNRGMIKSVLKTREKLEENVIFRTTYSWFKIMHYLSTCNGTANKATLPCTSCLYLYIYINRRMHFCALFAVNTWLKMNMDEFCIYLNYMIRVTLYNTVNVKLFLSVFFLLPFLRLLSNHKP